jgi:hypothetical protein
MSTSRLRGGSRIHARDRAPSVNLAKLADILAKSVAPVDASGPDAMPLASTAGSKVRLNIRGVLGRLLKHRDFEAAFAPGEDTGFLRDAEPPPFGTTARMGGRLVQGSGPATAKGVGALRDAIAAEIDRGLASFDTGSLVSEQLESALAQMAQTIGVNSPDLPRAATMVPIQFTEADRPAPERERDIGRLLSGIETVDGRDWLELLLSGIERKLQHDQEDQDDIDEVVTALRNQSQRPGSQIRRFLEFLEDEAMARVRLQVCMRLMSVVATQSNREGFKSYVRRARECFDAFAGAEGETLELDVGAVYGVANNIDLAQQLRKAMFYGCLSVWAEGSVQLFERRIDPAQKQPTLREVSYRFRVNGTNPETGKSAFDSRLDRIHRRLLESPGAEENVRRPLAELVFLSLVMPASIDDENPGDVRAEAASIAANLNALARLHARLLTRGRVMDELADELIRVLKTKSTSLVSAANRTVDKFLISVHRDVVDWAVVKGMSSSNEDVLIKPQAGPDSVAWFGHIRVAERVWPGSLASIAVETRLQERSLALAGEPHELRMQKSLRGPVLTVRLVPYAWSKSESAWTPAVPNPEVLDSGRGIDVEYDLRLLTLKKAKDGDKARSEQLRTAMVAASGLVIYIALWELLHRVKTQAPDLTMTIVRLQQSGKRTNREADAHDGNTAVYAVSQAIEKALARELPVKLQGLTTENDARDSARFKQRGALAALLGAQPVRFEHQGSLEKVAVLTYVTRPCDSHPASPDADGYLFLSRSYVANSHGGETDLRVDRMLSRVVDNRKDFRTPHLILEEIARLRSAGYRHILMLSHHFGNRHIGRAAERHAPHGTLEFLDEVAKRFPDVHLYPLRRDVFPATRLRKRLSTESGFEVLRYDAHQKMYRDQALDVLRSLLPIYTFATLHVVGDEDRPQSGFCTYFFDAEHRLSDFNLKESTRANILGTGEAEAVRQSLVSVLRAIHFMESEKPSDKTRLMPVLDPFEWATPKSTAAAGEVEVMSRRGGRAVLLSMPAVLAHVTKVLHKEALDSE